jgi:CHASE2 domain-containing sensor protein
MKKHRLEILFAPLFLFFSMFLFSFIFDIEYLRPAEQAINDFEITDISYEIKEIERQKQFNAKPIDIFNESDTNIVIIDIGKFSKKKLFYLLKILTFYSPKAIGIHLVVNEEGAETYNDSLIAICKQYPNIVFGSNLYNFSNKTEEYLQIEHSWGKFLQYANSGFINMPFGKDKKINTVRTFVPKTKIGGISEDAFATQMVKIFDKDAFGSLMKRNNSTEFIRFYGNYQIFTNLSAQQILANDFSPEIIKNRMILIGHAPVYDQYLYLNYMSFSPLSNFKYGTPYPDMYDLVIQANIIKMMLEKKYYNTIPYFWTLILTIIVIYFNFWLFFVISDKIPLWYEILSNLLFLFQSILILILVMLFFEEYNIYADLTTTLLALGMVVIVFEAYRDSIVPFTKKVIQKLIRGVK